jgi:Zn-dependent peptidase ImmA (M78 family)/DNA-binding XRE family transcriptional regulator
MICKNSFTSQTELDNVSNKFLGVKLRSARLQKGLSTRQVSEQLRGSVSHSTIANYELGKSTPSVDIVAELAQLFGTTIDYFFQPSPTLVGPRFRKTVSQVSKAEEQQYLSVSERFLDAYLRIEAMLDRKLVAQLRPIGPNMGETPEQIANRVRVEAKIAKDAPIDSVPSLLERFGIRVIEIPMDSRIDGLAAEYAGNPVVVINPRIPSDRGRLVGAHELKHVLYGDYLLPLKEAELKRIETEAFDFGSYLLIPQAILREAFSGRSMVKLVRYKERFGISLAAMLYRAHKTEIVSDSDAKRLWIEFSKRGWRKKEPGSVRPDRATRFEQLYEEAVASSGHTEPEILRRLNLSREDIESRLRLASGSTAADPQAQDDSLNHDGEEPDIIRFPE